jgi:hypothetical protein
MSGYTFKALKDLVGDKTALDFDTKDRLRFFIADAIQNGALQHEGDQVAIVYGATQRFLITMDAQEDVMLTRLPRLKVLTIWAPLDTLIDLFTHNEEENQVIRALASCRDIESAAELHRLVLVHRLGGDTEAIEIPEL